MTGDRPWLYDDLLVLVAPTAVAVAFTACLWHFIRPSRSKSIPPTSIPQLQQSPPPVEPKDSDPKSTRSKERRRRGKNPFRDLLKGGKRSKALLKSIKATDSPLLSPDDTHGAQANDTASSASRSPSPEPAADLLDMDRLAGSDGGSTRSTTRNEDTSVTSVGDISDRCSSDACSQPDGVPDSTTSVDAEGSINAAVASSPSVSTAGADPPRHFQADSTSGSCAKLVRARTRLRLSRMDQGAKASSSPLPDNVASSFNAIVPCSSLSQVRSTTDVVGPSTPTNSRGSTPPPESDETRLQLAAMRNALEAARVREEQLRREAEQASRERDELRWGWNEDASAWRRRETELQAHIQYLMQQLQAYVAVASFQATTGFSSPTSPHARSSPRLQHHPLVPFPLPAGIQAQNSASAPAHVQAMLASAPMLPSHGSGFAAAPVYAGGMSPLLWSGMGLCVPNRQGGRQTPDSSTSSSSRGRGGRSRGESASDESSLEEEVSGDEQEEDIFRNNVLADAILKRPESIRGLGRPPVRERMDTLKDPALEKASFVPAFP